MLGLKFRERQITFFNVYKDPALIRMEDPERQASVMKGVKTCYSKPLLWLSYMLKRQWKN